MAVVAVIAASVSRVSGRFFGSIAIVLALAIAVMLTPTGSGAATVARYESGPDITTQPSAPDARPRRAWREPRPPTPEPGERTNRRLFSCSILVRQKVSLERNLRGK